MKESVESIDIHVDKNVIADSIPGSNINMPEYYDIEKATMYCYHFDHSRAYRPFVIKLIDVKSKYATIQFEDEDESKQQLPLAFCDTLAHYLFRFYVKEDPIILSKKKTNIEVEETVRKLKVNFSYRNQVFKKETDVWIYRGGYMVVYSQSFKEFCDWIRYLCDQYYYNYNNPYDTYW